jgi:hypothetical protein
MNATASSAEAIFEQARGIYKTRTNKDLDDLLGPETRTAEQTFPTLRQDRERNQKDRGTNAPVCLVLSKHHRLA